MAEEKKNNKIEEGKVDFTRVFGISLLVIAVALAAYVVGLTSTGLSTDDIPGFWLGPKMVGTIDSIEGDKLTIITAEGKKEVFVLNSVTKFFVNAPDFKNILVNVVYRNVGQDKVARVVRVVKGKIVPTTPVKEEETKVDEKTPANETTKTDEVKPVDESTKTDEVKPADETTKTDEVKPVDEKTTETTTPPVKEETKTTTEKTK